MPAWLFAGGIFAVSPLLLSSQAFCYIYRQRPQDSADPQYDLFGALYRPNSTTDSAGHLGGIVAGLGAAMLFRKGRFPRGPRLR